jgi:hypothetical protein
MLLNLRESLGKFNNSNRAKGGCRPLNLYNEKIASCELEIGGIDWNGCVRAIEERKWRKKFIKVWRKRLELTHFGTHDEFKTVLKEQLYYKRENSYV